MGVLSRRVRQFIASVTAAGIVAIASAETPPKGLVPSGDRGYWFYREPPPSTSVSQAPSARSVTARTSPAPAGDPCASESTWQSGCGFVAPTSYSMQEKERDALLKGMVMHPDDPAAVLAAQQYSHWVVGQAEYLVQVWTYNSLQHPELDPAVNAPISAYGLQMATRLDGGQKDMVWKAIRDFGGIVIAFSAADCDYCRSQAAPLRLLEQRTGLTVWDASIRGPCLDEFKTRCVGPDQSSRPASLLQVGTVPMVYLYLPGNVWIRVSAGLTDATTMTARIENFFIAWRNAAAKGIQSSTAGLDLNPADRPQTGEALRQLLVQPVDHAPPSRTVDLPRLGLPVEAR